MRKGGKIWFGFIVPAKFRNLSLSSYTCMDIHFNFSFFSLRNSDCLS